MRRSTAVVAVVAFSLGTVGCKSADEPSAAPATAASAAPVAPPSTPTTPDKPKTTPAQPPKATGPVKPGTALHRQLCSPAVREADTARITGTPWKKDIAASTFYIGEDATPENAMISNVWTAWNAHAVQHFGGRDSWGPINTKAKDAWDLPHKNWYKRDGLCPKDVILKQNPFYVALPAPDHDENKRLVAADPWVVKGAKYLPELRAYKNGKFAESESPFKNLWVQVTTEDNRTAFAQLEDAGPSDQTDAAKAADYGYVWGTIAKPKNDFGLGAGIDLSPALSEYLKIAGDGHVNWRFVPATQVPDVWKTLITTGPPDWS